jgi:hypothetical protein
MADMTDGERIAEERIAEAARTGQDWLDLGDLGLKRLPEALSRLTKLKRVSLGNLHQVNAGGSNDRMRATERSSFSDISALSGLIALQELYLENTRCDDLSPIAGLQQLQKLNCGDTEVSDLSPIAGLQQLQTLSCWGTKVSDLSPIAGLQQLQNLYCGSTKVRDLSPIAGLQQLQNLNCFNTRVSDLSPIAGLQQLQNLDCDGTKVSDLSPLIDLSNLTSISARCCKIRALPPEIGQLHRLELLDLEDNPLEDPLPKLIAPGQPQATINVLRWLRGEPIETEAKEPDPPTPVEDADDPPAIPEQGAGPRVILDQTGRLVFARPSDLDAKGNDRNRLEALHPALREAAADLAKALQDHPSNLRNERLLQKAEAYRALVDLPLEGVDFARLYAAGMQLLNAAGATRRALEAGRADVPDLTPLQDECLDNIENLHPPFVLASRDGAEMLADQTTIKLTADHVELIKEAGEALGEALLQRPDLAAPEIGKTMRDAAAEIGQGENAARDAINAVSSTRNTVIVAVWVATAVSLPTIGSGFAGVPGAVSGGLLGYFLGESVKASGHFKNMAKRGGKLIDASAEIDLLARVEEWRNLLIQNSHYLRNMMHVPKFEWLKPVIDRLKHNSPPDKKE